MVKSETGSSILPLLRMRSANMLPSALKIAFSATILQTYRFSGMPDRMAWSDLIPEVVLWPFLRMRSKIWLKIPLKLCFWPKFRDYIGFRPCRIEWRGQI